MENFLEEIFINGHKVSLKDIKVAESKRNFHVLTELHNLGINLYFENQIIQLDSISNMTANDLSKALLDTKKKITDEKMLNIYAAKLQQSDLFWKRIAATSKDRKNFKASIVEMNVTGVTVQDFLNFNKQLNATGNSSAADLINPEHYVFTAQNGQQNVMENLGIIEEPTYFKLTLLSPDIYSPVAIDKDTTFAMGCHMFLQSDGTDMKIYGLHQFKKRQNGLSVKLGIFFPEATPDFVVTGHQEHLATEFSNSMKLVFNSKLA